MSSWLNIKESYARWLQVADSLDSLHFLLRTQSSLPTFKLVFSAHVLDHNFFHCSVEELWLNVECCHHRRNVDGVREANALPIFFVPKISFFGCWVEEGQVKKIEIFQNYYWVLQRQKKLKNLHFMGCRIEAFEFLIPMVDFASPPPLHLQCYLHSPENEPRGTPWIGCRVASKTTLNTLEKQNTSCYCRQLNHDFSYMKPVALSLYSLSYPGCLNAQNLKFIILFWLLTGKQTVTISALLT